MAPNRGEPAPGVPDLLRVYMRRTTASGPCRPARVLRSGIVRPPSEVPLATLLHLPGTTGYSDGEILMSRYTLITLALLFGLSAHPLADAQSDAQAQVKFGNEVARLGLWKEAIYRFQRAVDVDPTYAPAWNNLGIGYEHEGRMEDAREAYETALDLDPSNLTIETNYDLFLEVSDRVSEDSR